MSKLFAGLLICFAVVVGVIECACPTIKTRRQWGGRAAVGVDYQPKPVKYAIIHHTVGQKCTEFSVCSTFVKNIQDYHMDERKWHDIGYNFLIGNDGNVYEGVGWHKIGAHTYGYNSRSIGIAFMGNFNNELPSQAALDAGQQLLSCGVELGELERRFKLIGARQAGATESPGTRLYEEIQDWDNWTARP